MLPNVEPNVLSANPKFEVLWRDLCANKLCPDGTTEVDIGLKKDRDSNGKHLAKARLAAAKDSLIRSYLQRLAKQAKELSIELQDLLEIINAALHSQIDASLLKEDVSGFTEHTKPISKEIWKFALDDLIVLARICSPAGNIEGEDLPRYINKQRNDVETLKMKADAIQVDLINESVEVYGAYLAATQACIRILEQTIHGAVARHTKANATYLAVVAEGMSKKLELQHAQLLAQTMRPEMAGALGSKMETLSRQDARLKSELREAEEKLEEYHSSGGVGDVARDYFDILLQARRAEADIQRLQQNREN